MFYILLDKNFHPIGKERATYPVKSWKITKRAFDFDDIEIEGMKVSNLEGATYLELLEDKGNFKDIFYSGYPKLKNNLMTYNCIDLRKILDTNALIDLTIDFQNNVSNVYKAVIQSAIDLNCLGKLGYGGISQIQIDTRTIENLAWINNCITPEKKIGNVWKTIQSINAIYNCCLMASLDVESKVLTFRIVTIDVSKTKEIKLDDFNTSKIKRSDNYTNHTIGYYHDKDLDTYSKRCEYYLTINDEVKDVTNVTNDEIALPVLTECFDDEDDSKVKTKCIETLFKNRFKENVEITNQDSKFYKEIEDLDFDCQANIYGFNSDDKTKFKTLPVMEKYEDSKGIKKIKFGRLNDYWWLS